MNEPGLYGTDWWIGSLPAGWQVAPVGAGYSVLLGKMLDAGRQEDAPLRPYLANKDVQWGRFTLDDLRTMPFSDGEWGRYGVEPGDLLVCEGGEIGRCSVWAGKAEGIHFQKALHRLRSLGDSDPRYLAYTLEAAARGGVFEAGEAKSTIAHLTREKLAEFRVPVPPPEVERRIADFLDTETARIDTLLATNHHAATLARDRFERGIIDLVTGARTGHRSMTEVWGQPCAYEVGPYAMYGRTGSGHTPSRSVDAYWVDCDTPWVTTGDVAPLRDGFVERIETTREQISKLGMANSAARLHPAGTVVLSRTASVGFAGIMARPMATSQDFFTWTPDARLDSGYVLWSLRAMKFAGHFDRLMYGSTHKTIYVPDLLPLRGPVPNVRQQLNIVDQVRGLRDVTVATLRSLGEQRTLLTERRSAMITAAVTGELEV